MKQIISEIIKQRFEKRGLNLDNLVKSHFDYNKIINMLNEYDVEQTVSDSYDDPENPEFCTWQDCNYVGNWASTQEELNNGFIADIKFINENVTKNNINIDDYFYTYKDKYQIVLYFPLRLIPNNILDDYLFVFSRKSRIVMPLTVIRNNKALYQIIEKAAKEGTGLSFGEDINLLIGEGLIKSCGTMPDYGVVFTIDNLLWTDDSHNVYKPIIAFDFILERKIGGVPFYHKSFIVVGSLTPDSLSSDDISMFKSENRYQTLL